MSVPNSNEFKPGLYRHFKGGLYQVLFSAQTHNHNGDVDVVYYSLTHRTWCTRPLRRDSRDEDSWLDWIQWPGGSLGVSRFVPEEWYQSQSEEFRRLCEKTWKETR